MRCVCLSQSPFPVAFKPFRKYWSNRGGRQQNGDRGRKELEILSPYNFHVNCWLRYRKERHAGLSSEERLLGELSKLWGKFGLGAACLLGGWWAHAAWWVSHPIGMMLARLVSEDGRRADHGVVLRLFWKRWRFGRRREVCDGRRVVQRTENISGGGKRWWMRCRGAGFIVISIL